jgi:8-oxo-dGTP pyrophosphatase MutT (NUDIX family)
MGVRVSPQPGRARVAEQVAAVCYRVGEGGMEFLLVQTSGGRWTFPKGNVEPRLTHAQSAGLEAFEEAGVHGRMEEDSFARYTSRKRSGAKGAAPIVVHAHLCEVIRLEPPQESKRNPTWFSAAKAKRRLRADRGADGGAELARMVDRAVARVERQRSGAASLFAPAQKDPLQKVPFEAAEAPNDLSRLQDAVLVRDLRRRSDLQRSALQLAVDAYLCDVLRLNPPREQPEIESDWAAAGRARALVSGRKSASKQLPN